MHVSYLKLILRMFHHVVIGPCLNYVQHLGYHHSTMVYVVVITSLERFQKLALCLCTISKDWSANYEDLL